MTALCGGGTSAPKAGQVELILLGLGELALLLEVSGNPWLMSTAPALGVLAYQATTLCNTDPPPVPTFSAGEVAALFTYLDPFGHTAAMAKLHDLITNALWYATCECTAAATPAPPAALPPPAGLPNIGPINQPTPGAACEQRDSGDLPLITGFGSGAWWLENGFSPPGGAALPPGATGVQLSGYSRLDGTVHADYMISIEWVRNNGVVWATTPTRVPSGGSATTVVWPVMQNATHWRMFYSRDSAQSAQNPTDILRAVALTYCGTSPNTGLAPCGADPAVMALLNQIAQLVTLIQRQKAPFAYVPGPRHNGLVGSGQFGIHGLIGVSIILTTVPAYLGNIAGDPPELFDVGFVTVGTADGWHHSVRLDHNPTLIFPIEGSETLIGYTLEPNVVVDILELVREP